MVYKLIYKVCSKYISGVKMYVIGKHECMHIYWYILNQCYPIQGICPMLDEAALYYSFLYDVN